MNPSGEPDFRVTDDEKRKEVMLWRKCQLCGQKLGKWLFFTGGTECSKVNQYFEPAAHLDCLIYAMQVCPFIAGTLEHVPLEKIQKEYETPIGRAVTGYGENMQIQIKADETYTTVKSPYWVIKKATGYRFLETPGGTILMQPTGIVHETKPLLTEKMKAADWAVIMEELK